MANKKISVKSGSVVLFEAKTGKLTKAEKIADRIWLCNDLYIEFNLYGQNEYSVQFCGDDIFFRSLSDAVAFCADAE